MNRLRIPAVVFAIAALGTGSADAKAKPVTGTWTLTVEHVGMKLTLLQKKNTITGTLDWPHGDPFKLTGGFADICRRLRRRKFHHPHRLDRQAPGGRHYDGRDQSPLHRFQRCT